MPNRVRVLVVPAAGRAELERRLAGWLRRTRKITVSHDSSSRLWRRFCLQPHRTEGFRFSAGPQLEAQVRDVIGLYLHPPENAVVVCVDETSPCQALDRTQPILPVRPGIPERQTHDHADVRKRPGHPENKRITLHFTPTGCSWINLVVCFFSVITRQAIRRGSFIPVKEPVAAIGAFTDPWNDHPRPFAWTKDAGEILASIHRAKTKANALTHHQIQPRTPSI